MPLNCHDNSNALIIYFRSLFDIKGTSCNCYRSIILTLSGVIGDLNYFDILVSFKMLTMWNALCLLVKVSFERKLKFSSELPVFLYLHFPS